MKCSGIFVFKSLTYRQGGKFNDSEGNEVVYPACYILKVDELGDDGEINERKFKVSEKQVDLIAELKELEAYDKILLTFKVTIYATRISLEVNNIEEKF